MDIEKIKRLDRLIRLKATGNSERLAGKFSISKRTVYYYLRYMKEELRAPIRYCREYQSYIYTENGNLPLKWTC